ncbi:MAG: protoglobin domain-containing protein [Deltaproteobacteria bacterium]|nr:protoglobin domain-containing protein [Deltaproteobacteria bacterium]
MKALRDWIHKEKPLDRYDRERWLQYLSVTKKDSRAIMAMKDDFAQHIDEFIEGFCEHILKQKETSVFIMDTDVIKRLKPSVKGYFTELLKGNYGKDYFNDRLNIAYTHERIGVGPGWYIGAYTHFFQFAIDRIFLKYPDKPEKARHAINAFTKVFFLDMSIAMEAYAYKTHDRLKTAELETVYRLSRAAEYRDDQTGNHIMRLGHYSAVVARNVGMKSDEVEDIFAAAPMHDIGKIGVPDSILLKPDKLTTEEFEKIKTHSIIGGLILSTSESRLLQKAQEIALTHHERYDGTGYPHGLHSDEIPLSGKIIGVCDVFDALTTKRPYKPAFSNEEALSEIKKGEGSHFDPQVSDAFFKGVDEILTIQKRFQEETANQIIKKI